jgi:hypothetical protein
MLKSQCRTVLAVAAALAVAACRRSVPPSSPSPSGTVAQPARAVQVADGESLIRAMHDRYAGRWYHTMTFVQRTTMTRASQAGIQQPVVQTWYESLSLPGKLRIDVGNLEAGNGTLFRGDSTYSISDGRVAHADSGFNELLVLGFDVYTQPPELTASILRHLGFQLSRLRTGDLDGKQVYIVGSTSKLDSTSKQFWVERDRLVFLRMEEKRPSGQQIDLRFTDYAPAGQTWIARQVFEYINGVERLHEEYSDIKTDVPLDAALFDPRQWKTATHWAK